MVAYANGRVPASARKKIDASGRTLVTSAAIAWLYVVGEVHRLYGWTPTPSAGISAYRTLAEQQRIFHENYTPVWSQSTKTDARKYNGVTYWRRPGKAAAAVPGTSNHGWGRAVDVSGLGAFGSTRHRQFLAVAKSVGFSNAEGAAVNEPWHMVHDGKTAPPKPKPVPKPKPKPTPKKEFDTMHVIRRGTSAPKGTVLPYALVTGDRAVVISHAAAVKYKAAGVPVVGLPPADYDKITKSLVSEK